MFPKLRRLRFHYHLPVHEKQRPRANCKRLRHMVVCKKYRHPLQCKSSKKLSKTLRTFGIHPRKRLVAYQYTR
jgi:hypothetical protein